MGGKGSGGKPSKPWKCSPGLKPWERQPKETQKAWEAFVTYRDMEDRSIRKVATALGKSRPVIERWSRAWGWRTRIEAWDNFVDEQRRKVELKEIREMHKRHVKAAMTAMGVGLTSLQRTGKRLKKTEDDELNVKEALALFEAGAKIERLNRGEPESIEEKRHIVGVAEKRSGVRSLIENDEVREELAAVIRKHFDAEGE